MSSNKIVKTNSSPLLQSLDISLKITNNILAISDRKWWDNLELNWKLILLSNYCFNRINWTLQDCDIECFSFQGNIQNDLIDFAIWASGSDFDFIENIGNISNTILSSIIYETRMIWCANATVTKISPMFRINSLKQCKGIQCKLTASDMKNIKEKFDYFQGSDPDTNLKHEIGKKKT